MQIINQTIEKFDDYFPDCVFMDNFEIFCTSYLRQCVATDENFAIETYGLEQLDNLVEFYSQNLKNLNGDKVKFDWMGFRQFLFEWKHLSMKKFYELYWTKMGNICKETVTKF